MTINRSSLPARISATSSRARVMTCEASSLRGSSSSRMAGGRSGRMDSTRRSRVFIGASFYPGGRPVLPREDHERIGDGARRRKAREAPIERTEAAVDRRQYRAHALTVQDRGRDQVRRGVDPPHFHRRQAGRPEQRAQLTRPEQAHRAIAGILGPHAVGAVAHDLSPRLGGRQAVAETIAGDAVDERPGEVEAAAVLALEQQQALRPQHAAELAERACRIAGERQRAAAAHDRVEAAGCIGKLFDRSLHRRNLRKRPPGDRERARGDGSIRGLDVRLPMRLGTDGVDGLLERMRGSAFQGRRLGEAFDIWKRMIDGDCLIAVGLAGSMASAGMDPLVAWLVERGYVDVVVSTSANATEDVLEQRGVPFYQVDPDHVDDEDLWKRRLYRFYDHVVSAEAYDDMEYFLAGFFEHLAATWSGSTIPGVRFMHELGRWLEAQGLGGTIAATCFRHGVPLFVPAAPDGPLSESYRVARERGPVVDFFKDYEIALAIMN